MRQLEGVGAGVTGVGYTGYTLTGTAANRPKRETALMQDAHVRTAPAVTSPALGHGRFKAAHSTTSYSRTGTLLKIGAIFISVFVAFSKGSIATLLGRHNGPEFGGHYDQDELIMPKVPCTQIGSNYFETGRVLLVPANQSSFIYRDGAISEYPEDKSLDFVRETHIVTQPLYGVVEMKGSQLVYTAEAGVVTKNYAQDCFVYTPLESHPFHIVPISVIITMYDVVARPDIATYQMNRPLKIATRSLLANDYVASGSKATLTIEKRPSTGLVTLEGDIITFQPEANSIKPTRMLYRITLPNSQSSVGIVFLVANDTHKMIVELEI